LIEEFHYIQKPEGEYGAVGGHFFIDCACGSDKGCYYDETSPEIRTELEKLEIHYKHIYSDSEVKHTFYISNVALKSILEAHHGEKGENSPLVLVCDNCKNKFPLTMKFYEYIREESGKILKKSTEEDRAREFNKSDKTS